MSAILFKDESYAIMGAAFAVANDKGCGFLEPVYQECMEIECAEQNIPFKAQHPIHLSYKGHSLEHTYRPDLICFKKIIVERKATKELADEHRAQVLNYLHATGFQLGLLINFGHPPAYSMSASHSAPHPRGALIKPIPNQAKRAYQKYSRPFASFAG